MCTFVVTQTRWKLCYDMTVWCGHFCPTDQIEVVLWYNCWMCTFFVTQTRRKLCYHITVWCGHLLSHRPDRNCVMISLLDVYIFCHTDQTEVVLWYHCLMWPFYVTQTRQKLCYDITVGCGHFLSHRPDRSCAMISLLGVGIFCHMDHKEFALWYHCLMWTFFVTQTRQLFYDITVGCGHFCHTDQIEVVL